MYKATSNMQAVNLPDSRYVARSLNRSDARRDIVFHLCSIYPGVEIAKEISTATGYDERTVYGALVGHGVRYRTEDALVTLGIARSGEENYRGYKLTVFSATSNGEAIIALLTDYVRHHSTSEKLDDFVKQLEKSIKERGRNGKKTN